ncbi:thiamine phosphate synthase [Dietzia natronolimnaea]|uniref:Thiamine-phosphate synthase n=1 Tax=Dietzia natronolimnaea TaxID=161920 RepID=A0A2A2WSI3_9ACTN|nr:thiamine phosphate synthase [Dietzia natronolimnaea]PAY24172.1 thiamine phosphate synthase [Dietzia natronolimnaea]
MTAHADRLRSRLADARLYLCIDARRHLDEQAREQGWSGDFPALRRDVAAALAGGADIVQLRDKNSPGERGDGPLEAAYELRALAAMREVCDSHGALLAVNDRADVAVASGADVLHVGQDDLPVEWARRVVGDDVVIGLSCHAPGEVDAAVADPQVDYFCTGPVWPTPTKPGRHAPGLDLVGHAAARADHPGAKPWFAIGGINRQNLPDVLAAGARRAVVVRAITDADDPTAAARDLRSVLD